MSLQPGQPLLELLHPSSKINNELHAYLTPRVIDRLRLDTVHNRKIRCTKQETLPQAPTTERLLRDRRLQAYIAAFLCCQPSAPGKDGDGSCSQPELSPHLPLALIGPAGATLTGRSPPRVGYAAMRHYAKLSRYVGGYQ